MSARDPDAVVGYVATAAGSAGLTIQWATDFGSLVVMSLNAALALGGLYLLWLRIRRAHNELKQPPAG